MFNVSLVVEDKSVLPPTSQILAPCLDLIIEYTGFASIYAGLTILRV
jgi:hypothetical protein